MELISQGIPLQDDLLSAAVHAAKRHLNADICFLAEFRGELQFTEKVAQEGRVCKMAEGENVPFSQTYCYQLMAGKIPNIINDAKNNPTVSGLDVTNALNIGGYIGVPVPLSDGSIYGTLCCVLHSPAKWGSKDLKYLSILAEIVGAQVEQRRRADHVLTSKRRRVSHVIRSNRLHMVYQPIVELSTGDVVGAESLARFDSSPQRSPDQWFAEASDVGLGIDLELHAVSVALEGRKKLPRGAYLSVNISPDTLVSDRFLAGAGRWHLQDVVFEITEHQIVRDYDPLRTAIKKLRNFGATIAIDDVGAGYSGLNHILRLQPDMLKLDLTLVSGIYEDPSKQALATAVATFAARTGIQVIAEGVETAREMDALRLLGINYGQGYHFAKPGPLPFAQSPQELYQSSRKTGFGYAG
ncbi:MAG: EAL domain-containing protein [Pseudomonadota bacterium]|nr:EAL domain-containing protein [Pseudomonadota bacterium]MEE3117995.1 EAL domain-containing protein [Pseudomonadota bacterium]